MQAGPPAGGPACRAAERKHALFSLAERENAKSSSLLICRRPTLCPALAARAGAHRWAHASGAMLCRTPQRAALRSRATAGPQETPRCPAWAQLRPAAASARPARRAVVRCSGAPRSVVLTASAVRARCAFYRAAVPQHTRGLTRRPPAARQDGEEPPSDGAASGDAAASSQPPEAAVSAWLSEPALLQALTAAKGASEALAALGEAAGRAGRAPGGGQLLLSPAECDTLLETLVTARRVPLAMEVYEARACAPACAVAHASH